MKMIKNIFFVAVFALAAGTAVNMLQGSKGKLSDSDEKDSGRKELCGLLQSLSEGKRALDRGEVQYAGVQDARREQIRALVALIRQYTENGENIEMLVRDCNRAINRWYEVLTDSEKHYVNTTADLNLGYNIPIAA